MKKALTLILFIISCQLTGALGSIFTIPAIPTWYASLNKPVFNPPNWIFAPVWTTLYFLMAIAAFLIFQKGWQKKEVRYALKVFTLQLGLNSLWSFVFFGLKSPSLAFAEIVFLWGFVYFSTILFYKISKPAGILLIPSVVWVAFASLLNLFIVKLN